MKTLWATMLWDWRLLLRSRAGVTVALLTLAFATLAAWNGTRYAADWRVQADMAWREADDAREKLLADIASGDCWAALPFSA